MPHFPKPFFKQARGCWYVEIDRRQHNLGPDKDQAFERYHEVMRNKPQAADCSLAVGVIDAFLDWAKQNQADRTYEWSQRHLQVFAKSIPPLLSVGQLKKHHLTACLAKLTGWSPATKNGLCRAACRAFQWAEDEEHILRSPLRRFKKPPAGHREILIPSEEFSDMLAFFPAECIRDLLCIAWETGARPQEIVAVEARHVDLANGRWVFPIQESKGKAFPRIVYLNDGALAITRRLVAVHPEGPLFRNTYGEPWNRHSLNCIFSRLHVAQGLRRMKDIGVGLEQLPRFNGAAYDQEDALREAKAAHERRIYERRKQEYKLARKHARKRTLYHFRHSFATAALRRGLDPLTVSILLGHTNPSTLTKVYAHLSQDPDFLRNAAKRATGDADAKRPA
jgi:integrase